MLRFLLVLVSPIAMAQLSYEPYSGNACQVYEDLDVSYEPLKDWVAKVTGSCTASNVREAQDKTVEAREKLRRYVTAGRDETVNDPVHNPSFRPSGANIGAGELYFAAECAVRTCGDGRSGGQRDSSSSDDDDDADKTYDPGGNRPPPPPTPKPDDTFLFRVCNSRSYRVWVAIIYKTTNPEYTIRGWYEAHANQCTNIGRFKKGYFYFVGRTFQTNPIQVFLLPGKVRKYCVEEKQFSHAYYKTCSPSSQQDFSEVNVSNNELTWNIR